MNIVFVLMVMTSVYGGQVISMQEFVGAEQCAAAKEAALKMNRFGTHGMKAECLRKQP